MIQDISRGLKYLLIMGLVVTVNGCGRQESFVRVGLASQEIMTIGNNNPDYSVHDSVYARVIWVEGGQRPFGIVSLDVMEFGGELAAAISRSISDSLGLPEVRVTVCPSHNHSGTYHDNDILAGRIGSIARRARQAARPAQIGYCRVDVGDRFVVNRRVRIDDRFGDLSIGYPRGNRLVDGGRGLEVRGQVVDFIAHGAQILGSDYANDGVPDTDDLANASPESRSLVESLPDSILLGGPVDTHLEAVIFKDMGGEILGTLLRFACHATSFRSSWAKAYSADYPGVLCAEVSRATGGAPAHFVQGPCGNTKPLADDYGEIPMTEMGTGLARLILDEIDGAEFKPLESVYWHREVQQFQLAPDIAGINDEVRTAAEQDFARLASGPFDPYELKKAHDWSVRTWASSYMSKSATVDLPFTLIGFNDIALVNMPGEIFAELGLDIKDRFPDKKVVVVELADDNAPMYVPTREAYPMGGYEVSNSSLPAGSGERMVDICCEMLEEFHR